MVLFSRVSMFVPFCLRRQRPKLWNSKRRNVELALFFFSFLSIRREEKKKTKNARSFCFFSSLSFLEFKFKEEKKILFLFLTALLRYTPKLKPINISLSLSLLWIRVLKQWIFTTSGSLFSVISSTTFFLAFDSSVSFFLSLYDCVCCMGFTLFSCVCYGEDELMIVVGWGTVCEFALVWSTRWIS